MKQRHPQMKGILLPQIITFSPDNHNVYHTVKSSVKFLKNNNFSTFYNMKLRQSNQRATN